MEEQSKVDPLPPEPLSGVGNGVDDDNDNDILAWLSVDEDTVEELTKVLANGHNPPPLHEEPFSPCVNGTRVRFVENPYSATVVFQASSSYITINGNEETCGSSFSDFEASVMASVDTRGTGAMWAPLVARVAGDEKLLVDVDCEVV